MIVAHVAPVALHPYSGVSTVLAHLSAALSHRGIAVEFWHLSLRPAAQESPFTSDLESAGVEVVPMPVAGRFRLGRSVELAVAARRPDIVHIHGVFNLHNVLLARGLKGPYVVSPHGGLAIASLTHHSIRKRVFRRFFEGPLLDGAAGVCALTEVEAREVEAFGARSPVVVIGNGVPALPVVDSEAFRRELGIGSDPLAIFVGRLDLRHKAIDELVMGAADAPGWHVALIGPDFRGGRPTLERLAASMGVADRVHFTGPKRGRALYEAMAAADVFALPSRWEGFPVALLEAAAVGTPALISSAVEERIGMAAAGAATTVATGGWGEAFVAWQRSSVEMRLAGRHAVAEFVAGRSWSSLAADYEGMYRSAIAAPGRPDV